MGEYHDAAIGVEGQVTPTVYNTAGALTTVTSTVISTPVAASQVSTQDNNGVGLFVDHFSQTMTTVAYGQSEPGWPISPSNPKRS